MKQTDNSKTSNTEMTTISRAEYEEMQTRIQWLTEQLILKKKKIFGIFSEQIDHLVMEQFAHLFNEVEGWDQDSYVPATKVKAHSRKRRSGSITDAVPEGTAVEVVEHRLPEEDRICALCGTEMVEIGKEVRRSLQMELTKFWVQEDWYYTYVCKVCEQETGETVGRLLRQSHRCCRAAWRQLLPLRILLSRSLSCISRCIVWSRSLTVWDSSSR